jgi:hypothetical protein
MVKRTRKQSKRVRKYKSRRQRGGGLSDILPITSWGNWLQFPGSTLWGPSQQAPPPLANGGLYNAPQSTGGWASSPMPATQYAMAVESARTSGIPQVFYHQRPTTEVGNSWSPYVGQSISNNHWSARLPANV